MTTFNEAERQTFAAAGRCPFCGHTPVIEFSLDGRSWGVVERCEHAVTGGGQDCAPVLDRARDWQGPGWPWHEGWPVARGAE